MLHSKHRATRSYPVNWFFHGQIPCGEICSQGHLSTPVLLFHIKTVKTALSLKPIESGHHRSPVYAHTFFCLLKEKTGEMHMNAIMRKNLKCLLIVVRFSRGDKNRPTFDNPEIVQCPPSHLFWRIKEKIVLSVFFHPHLKFLYKCFFCDSSLCQTCDILFKRLWL